MVFSTNEPKIKKSELFNVSVLQVITGKPQTLACDISGMQGRILICFSTCLSATVLSKMRKLRK